MATLRLPRTKSKYRAVKAEVDGIKFDSKKEAKFYSDLKILKRAGMIKYFLMQVPFRITGGIKYKCDFMVVNPDDTIDYYDVKGFRTPVYKIKKKQVEHIYKITIKET
ncbi:MAG: DUF1064 domain-containing protein [Candidatus Peribacteraceae bacterium]|nr:DUF1064 domain-containing protein [Candidatus Peribacteraceae bacterium]